MSLIYNIGEIVIVLYDSDGFIKPRSKGKIVDVSSLGLYYEVQFYDERVLTDSTHDMGYGIDEVFLFDQEEILICCGDCHSCKEKFKCWTS